MSCDWPWHNQPGCSSCRDYEAMYGDNITRHIDQLVENRIKAQAWNAAQRAARAAKPPEPA